MKIEPRGKYAGVKIHLDAEECEVLLSAEADLSELSQKAHSHGLKVIAVPLSLAKKMGTHIRELLSKEPDLLKERTPEQIAAILAKESEKAALQLQAVKSGKDWKKVDPSKLTNALLKHVKE